MSVTKSSPQPIPAPTPVNVAVGGTSLGVGYNINGVTLFPLRSIAEALGAQVEFSPQTGVNIIPKA